MKSKKKSLGSARLAPVELPPYGLKGAAVAEPTCAPVKAGQSVRVCMVKTGSAGPVLHSQGDVCDVLRSTANADRESFYAFHLDIRGRITATEEVSRGSLAGVEAHPREVFKSAILNNAAGLILAHNHPSGDPTPSRDDIELTKRLAEAGNLLGIPVRDHVIRGEGAKCFSMRSSTDGANIKFGEALGGSNADRRRKRG